MEEKEEKHIRAHTGPAGVWGSFFSTDRQTYHACMHQPKCESIFQEKEKTRKKKEERERRRTTTKEESLFYFTLP